MIGNKHVAVEVPLGSPQIKYFARRYQWCPRGGVLRCLVEDDENGQLVVGIDDQELSLEEFGRMLTTYVGWGMRGLSLCRTISCTGSRRWRCANPIRCVSRCN